MDIKKKNKNPEIIRIFYFLKFIYKKKKITIMKRLKTFEFFKYQEPEVEDITIDDLSDIIFDENEKPYIVLIGDYSNSKKVSFMDSSEFTELIFNEARGSKKPIVILVDDFDVIPSDLKDKCELIVTDEITDVAKMKMTLYSL
jgi:hypothetical protein